MRDSDNVFMEEVKRESYIRSLTDDFSVVDLVESMNINEGIGTFVAGGIGASLAIVAGGIFIGAAAMALVSSAILTPITLKTLVTSASNEVRDDVRASCKKCGLNDAVRQSSFHNGAAKKASIRPNVFAIIPYKVGSTADATKNPELYRNIESDFLRRTRGKTYLKEKLYVSHAEFGGYIMNDNNIFYVTLSKK